MHRRIPALSPGWRRFIHGQQLFWSLRLTLGVSIPVLLFYLALDLPIQSLAAGSGALYIGLIDLPGQLRTKHREMLWCALAVIASGALTAYSQQWGPWKWPVVILISAAGAYAMNFGARATTIGLNCVLIMAITQSQNGVSPDMLHAYLQGLIAGCLWYVYYSLLVCWLLRHQMHRRALADGLFATASLMRARARCYDPDVALEQARAQLLQSQNQLQQAHTLARDLILGELRRDAPEKSGADAMQLFNLYADIIDLYDLVTAAHTDFALLRQHPCPRLQRQLRDMLNHGGHLLERIAASVSLARPVASIRIKTVRLRDMARTLAAFAGERPAHEILDTLQDSIVRMQHLRRMIAKIVRDTRSRQHTSGLDLDEVLRYYQAPTRLFVRPTTWLKGPAPAYALRLSLAMFLALSAATLSGNPHGNWVVMTVAVALRPGFGLSRQRSIQRIQGTLLGCASGVLLLSIVQEPHILLGLTMICLMLSMGLASIDYLISAFFTSNMVMLVYHLMLPTEMHIADMRLLDTAIGATIALAMTYVLPCWESRQTRELSRQLLDECRSYLACLSTLRPGATIEYRANRRKLLTTLGNLSASLDAMKLDPPDKQAAVEQVQSLLLWGHLLISQGNALALRALKGVDSEAQQTAARALGELEHTDAAPRTPPGAPGEHSVGLPLCATSLRTLQHYIERQRP